MESLVLKNAGEESLSRFAAMIRCVYILSLRMGVYGKVFWHITDWQIVKKQTLTGKRILLLQKPVSELLEDTQECFDILDSLRKIKHLNPKQIILRSRAESKLKMLEDRYIDYQLENTRVENLKFYQDLVHQDPNLYLSFLQTEDVNEPFKTGSMSWMVDLRSPEGTLGPDILWLEPDFFKADLGYQVEWEAELERLSLPTYEEGSVRMISLFRVPSLMWLSETELKYLRKEISALTDPWHKAFNPIIRFWLGKTETPPTIEHMTQAVAVGRQIETALVQSALVGSQTTIQAEAMKIYDMEVCLGYFSTRMIWDYFRKQQFLSPETQTILDNHKNAESYRPFTPAFVLKSSLSETKPEEPEVMVTATRKWIALD